MVYISDILARQILDSRGNPTLEVDVKLSDGSLGRAAVPSGASTGEYEAYELRDNNLKLFNGKSVLKAIENINKSMLDEIIVTDTIPLHEKAANIKNIRQISVSEMLAETIRRIHQRESVSTLFMD